MTAEAFCGNCGSKLDSGSRFCTDCGSPVLDKQPYLEHPPQSAPRPLDPRSSSSSVVGTPYPSERLALFESRKKSAGVAIVLSFLLLGLGQVYVGRWARAAGFWVLALILLITIVGILLIPVLVIASMIDANSLAKQYNAELMRGLK